AMTVKQELLAGARELHLEAPLPFAQQELFQQEALARDRARLVAAQEIDRFVAKREQARRLETDDRDTALGVRQESLHVPSRVLAGFAEHALRDHRTPAALLVDELDPIAGRLEQLDRSAADLGAVVVDERIVEQHDVAARSGPVRPASSEPRAQRLPRERRQ